MSTSTGAAMVYTEATPNPEALKFVTNRMLLPGHIAEFTTEEEAKVSPLAQELFGFPFVQGVFITNNFLSITKNNESSWAEIIPSLRDFVREYLDSNRPIVTDEFKPASQNGLSDATEDEVTGKIKDILEKYVKPAVEMDGGAISFKSFEEGTVILQLQGACSGCPSSIVTLKAGIEGMMKRMIPEVKEVVAESI